jgi:hypothetical protein
VDNIAARVPREEGQHLRRPAAASGPGGLSRRADFVTTVAGRAGISEPQAAAVVHAVIDTLFAATEGGLMAQVSDYLPPGLRGYVGPAPGPQPPDSSENRSGQ